MLLCVFCFSEDRKITKEGFIRNNKGISSEGDLPDEFLAAIYDRIAANPISPALSSAISKVTSPA